MEFHESIIEMEFLSDVVITSALIDIYAKCGSLNKACLVFDKIPERNAVWDTMIVAYVQNGHFKEAMELFTEMSERSAVSWNVMVTGYARYGFAEKALEAYKLMESAGVKSKSTTFASVLPCCAKLGALDRGMDIHQNIIKSGFGSDVVIVNALIDMYAKCGSIDKAHELFNKMPARNIVTWITLITIYVQHGFANEALKLFNQMKMIGVKPNTPTISTILPPCAYLTALQ